MKTKRTNNTTPATFSVNSLNEISTVGGDGCSYDYNGNLIYEPWIYWYSLFFDYDAENQMKKMYTYYGVSQEDSWSIEFVYDGRGRLRQKTLSEWDSEEEQLLPVSVTRYVYDGMRVIQERNSGNTPTVSYTRGTDLSGSLEGAGGIGGLLARSHGYSGGSWSTHNYYHADGNGNVTYLVDSSQSLAAKYRYDPYGNTISSSGSLASANVYCFSSKERVAHDDHDLYYYGYRWYEPTLQRWMNRDPLGEDGGINLYGFVLNDPVNDFDADGLSSKRHTHDKHFKPRPSRRTTKQRRHPGWTDQKTGKKVPLCPAGLGIAIALTLDQVLDEQYAGEQVADDDGECPCSFQIKVEHCFLWWCYYSCEPPCA